MPAQRKHIFFIQSNFLSSQDIQLPCFPNFLRLITIFFEANQVQLVGLTSRPKMSKYLYFHCNWIQMKTSNKFYSSWFPNLVYEMNAWTQTKIWQIRLHRRWRKENLQHTLKKYTGTQICYKITQNFDIIETYNPRETRNWTINLIQFRRKRQQSPKWLKRKPRFPECKDLFERKHCELHRGKWNQV